MPEKEYYTSLDQIPEDEDEGVGSGVLGKTVVPTAIVPIDPDPARDPKNNKRVRTPNGLVLSFKKLAFVNHFLSPINGFNAERAKRLAGFGKNTNGTDILRDPDVSREIKIRLEKVSVACDLTPEMVLMKMWEEAQGMTEDTTSAARISALDKLMKYFGLMDNKNIKDTSKAVHVNINLGNSDAKVTASETEVTIDVPAHD